MIACCGIDGCALSPGHDGDCVPANLCGVDPEMSPEARAALDGVLRAAHERLRSDAAAGIATSPEQ